MTDWYEQHAEQYDRLDPGLAGDVAFYVSLARAVMPPVLEVGCGTGRVTIAVARAGVPVVGLDRSDAMLAVARRRGGALPAIRWIRGDVREFVWPERFGLAFIPHRTFQHLLTPADQRAALARLHHHLVPGGLLALNITNPSIAALAAAWARRTGAETRISRSGDQAAPAEPEQVAPRFTEPYRTLRLRQIAPAEMRRLLVESGFAVEAQLGWFDGRPFAPDSPEQVWVARA